MKVWDIVDQVVSVPSAAERRADFSRVVNEVISSAARAVFSVGLIVATSGHFVLARQDFASDLGAKVRLVAHRKPTENPQRARPQRKAPAATDTQFGQATTRLARAFEGYFQPTSDEEEFESDYSFS